MHELMALSDLPTVNAFLNGLSAILLTAGYYFIRKRNKTAHRNCMVSAFVASVLFLICYITYHNCPLAPCSPVAPSPGREAGEVRSPKFEIRKQIPRVMGRA